MNESDDRVVFKVGKVVTKEWALANSSFNSMAWVRCASDNVLYKSDAKNSKINVLHALQALSFTKERMQKLFDFTFENYLG